MQSEKGRNVLPRPPKEEKEGRDDSRKLENSPPSTNPHGPLAIWTTGVWERESMLMRWMEKSLMKVVDRWSTPPRWQQSLETTMFIRDVPPAPQSPKRPGFFEELSSVFRRT